MLNLQVGSPDLMCMISQEAAAWLAELGLLRLLGAWLRVLRILPPANTAAEVRIHLLARAHDDASALRAISRVCMSTRCLLDCRCHHSCCAEELIWCLQVREVLVAMQSIPYEQDHVAW